MSQENNFIPEQQSYKNLRPFPLFIKGNFPFIENTFEALDNYGLLCKVIEYLNDVIANENTVTTNTQALYNAFVELNNYVSNYFDNLDVQEEINTKLDEMVEDGTLQEIIADYLNAKAFFGFDNVEAMTEATNLIDGSYAQTLGFYEKNDGGSGKYRIRKITNSDVVDEKFILSMQEDETLIAELIIDNIVPETIGAKGNGTDDDTSYFTALINKNISFTLNESKTYKISTVNITNKDFSLNGNNSTVLITENGFVFADDDKYKKIENLNIIMEIGATQAIYCNSTIGSTSTHSKGLFNNIFIKTNDSDNMQSTQINGIVIKGGRNYLISNSHFRGVGIVFRNTINPSISSCFSQVTYLGILQESIDETHDDYACGLKIENTTVLGCTIGIKTIQSDSLQIDNCMIDYNDYPIVNIATGGLKVNNCFISSRNGNQNIYIDRNNDYENEIFRGNGRDTEESKDSYINCCTLIQHDPVLTKSSIEIRNGSNHNVLNSTLSFIGKAGIETHDISLSNFINLSIRSSLANSAAYLSYRNGELNDITTNRLENIRTARPIYVRYAQTDLNDTRSFVTKQEGTVVTSENSVVIPTSIPQGVSHAIISLSNSEITYNYTITDDTKITVNLGAHSGNVRINWIAFGKPSYSNFS